MATTIVEPTINAQLGDAEVLEHLHQYCSGLVKVLATGERVRQMVGRLLIEVRSRKLYEGLGYKSFNQFLIIEIEGKHGISRPSSYSAISVVEAMPDIDLDQAERVGSSRLALVARCIKGAEEPAKKRSLRLKLLKRAKKMGYHEFKQSIDEEGLLKHPHGEPKQVIVIHAGRQLMSAWKKMVGEDEPAEVLWRLLKGVRIKHTKRAA